MNLNSKTLINFFWLFFSSVAIKGIGVLRESIVASEIGNSYDFATFNIFRSVVDFLLAFAISVPVIESILVPKLAHFYSQNNKLSFRSIWLQSTKYGSRIFVLSIALLLTVAFIKADNYNPDNDILFWVLLFSIYLSVSLSNSVMYSLLKVVGDFRTYSYIAFFTAFGTLSLIYIFIGILGLKIILISSIVLIISSNFLIRKVLKVNFEVVNVEEPKALIHVGDFNLYKMIVVNHPIFIGYTGRVIIGLGTDDYINLYQYSFIIITSFLLVVVSNISSIILYKHSTATGVSRTKVMLVTFVITLLANATLYLFGKEIISLLYERGKFTQQDTIDTYNFLKIFLIPFTCFSLTQVMIQSYMTDSAENTRFFKILALIIAITISVSVGIGIFFDNFKAAVEILLYLSSFSIFIVLILKQKKLTY
jgi:putative peptidoglycan lipid II flippase